MEFTSFTGISINNIYNRRNDAKLQVQLPGRLATSVKRRTCTFLFPSYLVKVTLKCHTILFSFLSLFSFSIPQSIGRPQEEKNIDPLNIPLFRVLQCILLGLMSQRPIGSVRPKIQVPPQDLHCLHSCNFIEVKISTQR